MKLKKIILNGFKSFADKTEFVFDSPITAIVGPNGCGKSNVVDAVKWVLGEQSVKSLRSGQMADVIFGGSSSRKALGTAEVSLVLSNTTGQLPIESDEVQINRRIYKSGESEYKINGRICRLKDIKELFMNTGIGSKAYSIIEQGQVDQLVTASKADRRFLFEEAAGISKYKAHKKEALRKLDRTEQNLLRLADILGEIQKQLRSVKLQAGKARNYLAYSDRLKELQVNYSLVEYHKVHTNSIDKKARLGRLEEQFATVAAEVARNDALVSTLGDEIINTESELNLTDNSLVSVQSKIEQHLQRIEFLRARITELQQRKENAQERIEKLQEQKNCFETDITKYETEQVNCERMLSEKNEIAEQLQETIQKINSECISVEAQLEDEKSGIIDIVRRTAQLHNEVQSISVYRNNLSSQKDRLAGRAKTGQEELEKLLTEKAQYKVRQNDIEKVLSELEQSLNAKRQKSEELACRITEDNKQLAHRKENLSALSSEHAVLQDLETRREGLKGGVKKILQLKNAEGNDFDYIEGIVADIVSAALEYSNAVESALEGKTDALVVNDTAKLLDDVNKISELDGRANFLCIDKQPPFTDAMDMSNISCVKGRLIEFVKYDNKYAPLFWQLLGKTIVVDSIDAAIELSNQFCDKYNFVTLKGEFLSSDNVIKLGPLAKTAGLISRKSRLNQLRNEIDKVAAQAAQLEEQITTSRQQSEHMEKLCKDLRTATYEANTEKMQVNSRLDVTGQNIKRLTEEQPLITGEIGVLEEQISQSVQKEYDSKQKLQELDIVNSQRAEHIKELEAKYAGQKELHQKSASELTDLKVGLGQMSEQNKALKQTIASLQIQIQSNHSAIETTQEEIETSAAQTTESERDILKSEASVSELFVEKEKTQECSNMLHNKVKELLEKQKETEQLVRSKRTEETEVEQKISQLKIELGQLEVKEQTLIERVQEELQLDLVQSYENYTEDSDVDWDQIREEITELRRKIERLGNVNVDAIEEQAELEKRNEFLAAQVEDLDNSKVQLQQLITRLNKKSREKFRETFEEIRGHFQQLFRKLFGGGKADILLEDAEDILEAGIEIMAQPPGKETRSISLLSGGEKTMTAIALLFAVFKAKPSPFCLLDEVDAALDEANNERFNLIIREFKKYSQFIIITHAKRTMSIADVLYGVTMQIRGVSKKISVRFGEYEPEEETAAVA